MSEPTKIQSFYKGRTIFITGATGLMGKVLLEKLLWSCSDLDKIYILLRSKRGISPDIRLAEMFKIPAFSRLQTRDPSLLKKVIPLEGDVMMEKLGLSEQQRNTLANDVSVVFHCAATVQMNAKLKTAIEMNTAGTQRVLDMCKNMKQLKAMIHLSTTFCHVDKDELDEKVYDANVDPDDVIRLVQWLKEDLVDLLTPKDISFVRLIHPHPNTYTYSKRLAETIVYNEYPNLPCAIARPSIVIPSWYEPIPGWVDNINGPVGLLIGAGRGVIRSMHCNPDYHAEVIPIDLATNSIISIACEIGTLSVKPEQMPVFNMTQGQVRPITWREVLETGRATIDEMPFEGTIWYPDGDIRTNKFIHLLFVIFFHWLPAYLIDFLMLIFRQPRFMVRIQTRISEGLDVLQYFTTREWVFHNDHFLKLVEEMDPKDRTIFPIVDVDIDVDKYMRTALCGARQYCVKQNPDSIPRCRRQLRILYVIHRVTVFAFYFGVLYYICKNLELPKYYFGVISEQLSRIPAISGFLAKSQLQD